MPDKGPIILAICILCWVVIWVIIPMRLYVRIVIKNYFGADDVLAVVATIGLTLACCAMAYGALNHIWRPRNEQSNEQFSRGLQIFFICELLYTFTTYAIKLSFSITLLRIAKERAQIWAIWVVIAASTVFTIFYTFFILFTCDPIRHYWERALGHPGKCRNPSQLIMATYFHGIVMIGGDITMVVIPVIMVIGMKMDPCTKMTIIIILAFGSVASIATIARIPYVTRLADETNFLYRNVDIAIWSGLEVLISIVCTAASTLRPLLARTCLKVPDSTQAERQGYKNQPFTAPRRTINDNYEDYDLNFPEGNLTELEDVDLEAGALQRHGLVEDSSRPTTSTPWSDKCLAPSECGDSMTEGRNSAALEKTQSMEMERETTAEEDDGEDEADVDDDDDDELFRFAGLKSRA